MHVGLRACGSCGAVLLIPNCGVARKKKMFHIFCLNNIFEKNKKFQIFNKTLLENMKHKSEFYVLLGNSLPNYWFS